MSGYLRNKKESVTLYAYTLPQSISLKHSSLIMSNKKRRITMIQIGLAMVSFGIGIFIGMKIIGGKNNGRRNEVDN